MSDNNAQGTTPKLEAPTKPKSGMRIALEFTGIPPSLFDKKPRLPSRNWLIFISVTSSIVGYYLYDRRECSKIRQSYIDRVQHLAEQPLHSLDVPRKVTVYGAKWPGDEDYDRGVKYFRKYVKPILVAAAIDFEMVAGKRHGDIADRIADEIKEQRRIAMGIDPPPPIVEALAKYQPLEVLQRRKLDGGIVIVGRPTFKEFMAGTQRGWTGGLEKVEKEEALSHLLESDGHFDEPEDPSFVNVGDLDGEPIPTPSKLSSNNGIYSPLQMRSPTPPSRSSESIPANKNIPPTIIPYVPPILFVPFTNMLGFKQIPLMMWDFFNERHKVRSGSEAAYRLVMKQTRPIIPPSSPSSDLFPDTMVEQSEPSLDQHGGDLDFDKEAESYFKKSLSSTSEEIEKARSKYYEGLPAKLETARALARGTREFTSEEQSHPPPTEVELRAERMKKELRWRGDLTGWDLIKPEKGVIWDSRFSASMSVFVDPLEEGSGEGSFLSDKSDSS